MKQRYCVDTSLFINGWNKHYPPEMFPAFWDALDQLINEGVLFSCHEVFEEINAQDDELSAWCKKRKAIFEQPTENIILGVQELMHNFPNIAAKGRSPNAADPWVIAHSRHENAIVVTDEQPQENISKTKPPKIPSLCEILGIKWMRPVDFIRANGVRFDSFKRERK